MTFGDVLVLSWRFRFVTAVGLLLTGVALFLVSPPVEAWNVRVSVILLVPKGTPGNAIASTTTSLIATTGVVARNVNGPNDQSQTVSSDLTLASTETEPGWSLRQPNAGGQWDVDYEEPRLDVKAWGYTSEEASAQMRDALTKIEGSLTALQDSRKVAESQRIRLTLSPDQPVFTIQSGSRVRALAGTGLAGILVTLAGILGLERLLRGRTSAPEPSGADGAALDEFADSDR
ncbi:hypothetical protein [uncultured Friedmanniella sp.]|uniref:hypothetical protein n=1 Tax=uncultured Friedmanniella sp. TaxID=335381 RepID=UPI0035CADF5B